MDNLFRGDCILTQSEVIFVKKKKNKKKQQTPKQCILLITNNYVAFTDPINDNKELVGFPTTTITDFKYNQNTDSNFHHYLLEISVFIKNKTHEISIAFPTDNGKQQRDKFIKYFNTHKSKTNHRITKQKHGELNGETLRKRANKLAKHKYLSTLYETLVGKNILTANEFWDEYGQDMNDNYNKPQSDGLIQGMSNNVLQSTINNEEWSLFSVFKNDLHNYNQQNENKLTINLTAEKILQIFINLPEVKLAYDQHVPCHFSEPQFWKSFLQSHYFKRGTTKNITSNSSEIETETETEIDKLLKKYMTQIQNEQDINNENISPNMSDNDGDIDMMDKDENAIIEANKPLKRRNKYAKKMNKLDPAIDLTATMESFVEVLEDPGVDENQSLQRGDVQNWFNQVNKHGTMLLYQSLNPRNENKNVTKVNYGRKCTTNEEKEEDIKMENDDNPDHLDVMNMEYSDRLNIETEFEDLKEEGSHNYIELRIEDQSVYWSKHLLLSEKELYEINEYSVKLNDYLHLVEQKKKKLAQQQVKTLIVPRFVETTILLNTENNCAIGAANLASKRIIQNRKNNNNNINNNNRLVNEEILMIFTQNKEIVANKQILEQLSTFQKQMKELVRHYWHCFPANQQRLQKSQIIVENLKEYKGKLVECQTKLDKKSNIDKKIQKILLQELIDLAEKVLDHNKMTATRVKPCHQI